jgi:hypothetical protein
VSKRGPLVSLMPAHGPIRRRALESHFSPATHVTILVAGDAIPRLLTLSGLGERFIVRSETYDEDTAPDG